MKLKRLVVYTLNILLVLHIIHMYNPLCLIYILLPLCLIRLVWYLIYMVLIWYLIYMLLFWYLIYIVYTPFWYLIYMYYPLCRVYLLLHCYLVYVYDGIVRGIAFSLCVCLFWIFFFWHFTLPFEMFCSLCMLLTKNYDRPDIVFICLQLLKLCRLYVCFYQWSVHTYIHTCMLVLSWRDWCFYYIRNNFYLVNNSALGSWSCSRIKGFG